MNKQPIFFLIRRTARQVRIHAADSFPTSETFVPLSSRHPQHHEAQYLIEAFALAAKGLTESQLTAQALVDRAKQYLVQEDIDRLKVMSRTQICLRAKPPEPVN